MERTYIKDLPSKVGKKVKLDGWVHIVRKQGSIVFLILRDVTGLVQTVATKDNPEILKLLSNIQPESVLEIQGLVKEEKQAPEGYEVLIEEVTVLSEVKQQLPIPVVEKGGIETSQSKRLDWRWLDLRKPEKRLIFQVWTTMEYAFFEYCVSHGFTRIHSPKFMSTPSESGAELFEVIYFNRKAYLAQSPQFYKQMGMASGFEKVFETGPIFRANPSFTSRHDTEFTGYDLEISFINSHYDVMKLEEEVLTAMIKAVKEKYGDKIEEYYGRKLVVPKNPFPKITMKEAKKILAKLKVPSEKEGDLSPEEERKLSEYVKKEYKHEFVFVTDYPIDVRPFYHMRHEDDPKLTKSFDLLWNGLEITTGAQREHRYEILKKQAKEKGLSEKSLKHYLNFFKYGCPPHGGIGLGPSRMLMKIFNVENVREVTYLYRGIKRLTP